MQYLLMIYGNEAALETLTPEEGHAMMKEYEAFTQSIVASGHYRAGERLERSQAATTVRLKAGQLVTSDGPFAETKEQLGGYYLVEAKDLDEAIRMARRVPSVRFGGSVEIRPVAPVSRGK
jgi:hypothetical protein